RYPAALRLIAARILAGLAPRPTQGSWPDVLPAKISRQVSFSSQASEELRRYCQSILMAPLPPAREWYSGIAARHGKQDAALTLGELGDRPSLQCVVEYMRGEER